MTSPRPPLTTGQRITYAIGVLNLVGGAWSFWREDYLSAALSVGLVVLMALCLEIEA